MASLNKVLLIGNLVKDPELRRTASGKAVTNLRLAINKKFKDSSGAMKEEVCYVTVTVWDQRAEACSHYLKKGRMVFVEGVLQFSSWEKDGQKHSTLDVRADNVQFLGGDSKAEDGNGTSQVKETNNPGGVVNPEDITWAE